MLCRHSQILRSRDRSSGGHTIPPVGIDSIFGKERRSRTNGCSIPRDDSIPNVFEHRSANHAHHRKVNALLRGSNVCAGIMDLGSDQDQLGQNWSWRGDALIGCVYFRTIQVVSWLSSCCLTGSFTLPSYQALLKNAPIYFDGTRRDRLSTVVALSKGHCLTSNKSIDLKYRSAVTARIPFHAVWIRAKGPMNDTIVACPWSWHAHNRSALPRFNRGRSQHNRSFYQAGASAL